jgi:hypothetical protein
MVSSANVYSSNVCEGKVAYYYGQLQVVCTWTFCKCSVGKFEWF